MYKTEHFPTEDNLIYLHFFLGGYDWFISEYDGEGFFFGFAILNGDYELAERGTSVFPNSN
jgi:hypothetical protein